MSRDDNNRALQAKLARLRPPPELLLCPGIVRSATAPHCPRCHQRHRPSMVGLDRFTACLACGTEFYTTLVEDSLFPWQTDLTGPRFTVADDAEGGVQ